MKIKKKLNPFDLIAVIIISISIIAGTIFFYKIHIRGKINLENQKLLKEKQKKEKIKSLISKDLYFIIQDIPSSKTNLIQTGSMDSSGLFEIKEVLRQFPSLKYEANPKDPDNQYYHIDSSQYNILIYARIQLYQFSNDSIFYDQQPFISNGNLNLKIKQYNFTLKNVYYDKNDFVIQENFLIQNVPQFLLDSMHLQGKTLINELGIPLGTINNATIFDHYQFQDKVNNQTKKLISPHLNIIANLTIKLNQVKNKYYLDFLPYQQSLGGFIEYKPDNNAHVTQ